MKRVRFSSSLRNIENSIQYCSNSAARSLGLLVFSSMAVAGILLRPLFRSLSLSLFPTLSPYASFFHLSLSSLQSPFLARFLIVSVCLFVSFFFRRYVVLPGPSLPASTSLLPPPPSNFSRAPSTGILLFYQLFQLLPRAFQTSPSSPRV